jgi:hypothetical protein
MSVHRFITVLLVVALVAFVVVISPGAMAFAQASWTTPVDLSAAGRNSRAPELVMLSPGHAVASWYRDNGSNFIVQTSVSLDSGATWSSPVDVSAVGGSAYRPHIVADSTGRVFAYWYRNNGTNLLFQESSSNDGGLSWSTPVDISTAGGNVSDTQISIDSADRLIAVWIRNDGVNSILQESYSFDHGSTWSSPVSLSAPGLDASSQRVIFDSVGRAVLTWSQSNGTNYVFQSRTSIDHGVTWSGPVSITVAGGSPNYPQLATDSSGHVIAVWDRSDGTNTVIQSNVTGDGGATWSTPVNLSTAGGNANTAQISVDSNGRAIVVWTRNNGANWLIQSSYSSNAAATWSTPVDLSLAGASSYDAQVSFDFAGRAIVVWSRGTTSPEFVIQSTLSADGGATWSTPINASLSARGTAIPQVKVDSTGRAIALWQRTNGTLIIQSSTLNDLIPPTPAPSQTPAPAPSSTGTPGTSVAPAANLASTGLPTAWFDAALGLVGLGLAGLVTGNLLRRRRN